MGQLGCDCVRALAIAMTALGTLGCNGDRLIVGSRQTPCAYGPVGGWPTSNVEGICSPGEVVALPGMGDWIDNFEGGEDSKFDSSLAWRYESDNTGNVALCPQGSEAAQFGDVSPEPLGPWGSHTPPPESADTSLGDTPVGSQPVSAQGMRMAAVLRKDDQQHRDSTYWGIRWEFETPGIHGIGLTGGSATRKKLDFSGYDGVVVWARLAAAPPQPVGEIDFLVEFPTSATVDKQSGGSGRCELSGYCSSHLGHRLTITDTCWRPYRIDFDLLRPAFGGDIDIQFDRQQVFGIDVTFNNTVPYPFDVLIDDIYLFHKAPAP